MAVKCGLLPINKISPYLRYSGKPNKRSIKETRGKLSGCTSIERRPSETSDRSRHGGIEGNTVIGCHGAGVVLTLHPSLQPPCFATDVNNMGVMQQTVKHCRCNPCIAHQFSPDGKVFVGGENYASCFISCRTSKT